MKRIIYEKLLQWKGSINRKPLVLRGARQVGKTYILKEFGLNEYKDMLYISCERNEQLRDVFVDYDIDRILRNLAAIYKQKIVPGETFIVFDEIQEIPVCLGALKYFYENAPQYHIAVAGSLLGIALHENTSFPVGKVDTLELFPMNFEEFLEAMGENDKLQILRGNDWPTIDAMRISFIELLRQYYFVGGMPEVVLNYVQNKNLEEVRRIQKNILFAYANDISKHATSREIPRINMVWNNIPAQLAKENKKFIYGALKSGGRAKEFEVAIQWLIDCGLIYKINRITKPSVPLKFHEDTTAFKLFVLDCGLMGAMSDTPADDMLVGNTVFREFKGAFTELYVLQQLKTIDNIQIYYYSNESSTMEIDFVVQNRSELIPIEVKAEENLRSKSLKTFIADKDTMTGVRFSMSPFRDQVWMRNIPLYAVSKAFNAMKES